MTDLAARRLGWIAAFGLLSACTALVLLMLPDFGPSASAGLLTSAALGWLVLGWQLPRAARM